MANEHLPSIGPCAPAPFIAALEQLNLLIWTTDAQLCIAEFWGTPPEAWTRDASSPVDALLTDLPACPAGSPLHKAHLAALSGQSASCFCEWNGRRFESTIQPRRNAAGAIEGSIGRAIECTEKQTFLNHLIHQETVLDASESLSTGRDPEMVSESGRFFLEKVADSTSAIIYIFDIEKKHNIYTNRRFSDLLGYSREEVENPNNSFFDTCFHPDDLPALIDAHKRYAQASDMEVVKTTYRMRDKAGNWHVLRSHDVVFTRNEKGEPRQIIGSAFDITAQTQSEVLLRESEERWKSLANTSVDFLIMCDEAFRISYLNHDPLLPTDSTPIGKSVFDFIVADDHEKVRQCLNATLATGEFTSYETQGQGRDGDLRWYSTRVGPLRQGGKVAGVTLFVSDITERRQVEDSLRSERQLLRQFLHLMHRERRFLAYEIHDGFLQDIIGTQFRLGGLAESPSGVPEEIVDELQAAVIVLARAVSEARRLIGELRHMVIDSHGIVAAIEDLVDEISATSGIPITFRHQVRFDRLSPEFEGNVFRIVQESLNNINRHSRAQAAEVILREEQGQLFLSIVDNGIGFDPSTVKRDSFGLQSIQERARLFGGRATIVSKPGEGASVSLVIPLELPLELKEMEIANESPRPQNP